MNKMELMEKGNCPNYVADLVFKFLEYNRYQLEERNIVKIDYHNIEICLDDGTKIMYVWNDYIMQVAFFGSTDRFDYWTVINEPTPLAANIDPKLLEEQIWPTGVYTLLSNAKEKVMLAANPFLSNDIIEKEHDVLKQWKLAKDNGLHLNPTPVLQIDKYAPDVNISPMGQSPAAPISTDTKPINLFVNLNPHLQLSTLYDTINNAFMVTDEYMKEYGGQKS